MLSLKVIGKLPHSNADLDNLWLLDNIMYLILR